MRTWGRPRMYRAEAIACSRRSCCCSSSFAPGRKGAGRQTAAPKPPGPKRAAKRPSHAGGAVQSPSLQPAGGGQKTRMAQPTQGGQSSAERAPALRAADGARPRAGLGRAPERVWRPRRAPKLQQGRSVLQRGCALPPQKRAGARGAPRRRPRAARRSQARGKGRGGRPGRGGAWRLAGGEPGLIVHRGWGAPRVSLREGVRPICTQPAASASSNEPTARRRGSEGAGAGGGGAAGRQGGRGRCRAARQ